MRINRVRATAFGAFAATAEVDFAAGAAHSVLLIRGKTGSGKTTLLDAVSFAIYGSVARYLTSGKPGEKVRSEYADAATPTTAEAEFETAAGRYLVWRQAAWSRPKKRGAGVVTEASKATLAVWDAAAGQWQQLAAKEREVGELLQQLVPFSAKQFYQVMLLAQGEFKKFLSAKNEERLETLRLLFGSDDYERIARQLQQQARQQRQDLAHRTLGLRESLQTLQQDTVQALAAVPQRSAADNAGTVADTLDAVAGITGAAESVSDATAARDAELSLIEFVARNTALGAALAAAADRLESAAATAAAAAAEKTAAVTELQRIAELWDERAELRQQQLAHRAKQPQHEQTTARLRRAQRAAQVAAVVAQKQRDCAAAQAAVAAQKQCEAESIKALNRVSQHQQDLAQLEPAAQLAAVHAEHAAARQQLAADSAVEQLQQECQRLQAMVTAQQERGATLTAEQQKIQQQLAAAEQQLLAGRLASAALPQHQEMVAAKQRQLAAAQQVTVVTDKISALTQQEQRAISAEIARDKAHSELLTRRIARNAAELASDLRPGEPCQVCGSRQHPAPAAAVAAAPVSAAQLDAAAAAAQQAREHRQRLSTDLAALRAQLQEAQQRAAAEFEGAAQSLEELEAVLGTLQQQADAVPQLEQETAELQQQLRDISQELSAAEQQQSAAGTELELAKQRLQTQQQSLAAVVGTWPDLQTKLAALESLSAALVAAQEAQQHAATTLQTSSASEKQLHEQLSAAGFAAEDEWRQAYLSETAQQQLESEIHAYTARTAALESSLERLAAQQLPEQRPELSVAVATAAAAREVAAHSSQGAQRVRAQHDLQASQLQRLQSEVAALEERNAAALTLFQLAETVNGRSPNTRKMPLETYYLAAQLEAVVAAANQQLLKLAGGRYRLQHSDEKTGKEHKAGLGLTVYDLYAGRSRSTDSLSGGESFMVSLALALGLADTVSQSAGGIRIDSLFIDEGFGTLDPETLEEAVQLLDDLRASGRLVTVISHVPQLHEQFCNQVEVISNGRGVSTIKTSWDSAGEL